MKKINIDDTFKQDLITRFTNYINTTKFTDSKITFSANFDNSVNATKEEKPTVYISTIAYLKMMMYVRDTDTEIAWHGTVERNQKQNWYYIKDVFLYPQTIRATTVSTDQEKYQEWLQNIEDDEVFNNIRFQGHSHVNMAVSPSGTDLDMYDNFLQVLPKNDYYIFMIMNKSGDITCLIYDLAKNIIYETADINIKIITPRTQDLAKDIKEEKDKYCEKISYTYSPYRYSNYLKDDPYADYEYYDNKEDINDLIDDINNKYKNTSLSAIKKKNKIKVKGGKK